MLPVACTVGAGSIDVVETRIVPQMIDAAAPAALVDLPIPPTPLVGREREIAEVASLLCRDNARLVTLSGPGGVGKTRLALRAAKEVSGAFADGLAFVALAPIRDPAHILPTIAQALDVRDAGGTPLAERLAAVLLPKEFLLVLDNFEQV